MTKAFVLLSALVMTSVAFGSAAPKHQTHAEHSHKHGDKCGHKATKSGNHVDYEHDGHVHAADDAHYDEHHVGDHAAHKHGDKCGHKVVNHEGHKDFDHDGHKHFAMGSDYAEH